MNNFNIRQLENMTSESIIPVRGLKLLGKVKGATGHAFFGEHYPRKGTETVNKLFLPI